MKKNSARYNRGRKKLFEIHGQRGVDAIDSLGDVAPDLPRHVYEWIYGDLYLRGGLDMKSRQLATMSALVAMGNARPQLKAHIHGALNVGWTKKQIVEVIMQLAVYAGFPAALNALVVAREIFKERKRRG
jgi:4-carboxymuconolactone decarboxylase